MVRCAVCTKVQLAYVEGLTRTSCYYCGARWFQSGDEQGGIIGPTALRSAFPSMGTLQPPTEGGEMTATRPGWGLDAASGEVSFELESRGGYRRIVTGTIAYVDA